MILQNDVRVCTAVSKIVDGGASADCIPGLDDTRNLSEESMSVCGCDDKEL